MIPLRGWERVRTGIAAGLLWLGTTSCHAADPPDTFKVVEPGMAYRNFRLREGPWSIHVIRITRTNGNYSLHSAHAGGKALGLGSLPEQVGRFNLPSRTPVAAINGEFYKRSGAYAGDSRGLQIVEGELFSAANGGAAFWIDPSGKPVATNVISVFRVT